ncbi:MAG: hypothetical protein CM15mP49_26030 [Actinomycetota bacterium]|nr:MAG: hypothetical protein CM15mP49_26030 [Actinomycetota bacterium]
MSVMYLCQRRRRTSAGADRCCKRTESILLAQIEKQCAPIQVLFTLELQSGAQPLDIVNLVSNWDLSYLISRKEILAASQIRGNQL